MSRQRLLKAFGLLLAAPVLLAGFSYLYFPLNNLNSTFSRVLPVAIS
jgi:hypothetical protein